MQHAEVDKLLVGCGFTRDTDPSALDGYSYARYTKINRDGKVIHAHLHREVSGDIKVNLEKIESHGEKIGDQDAYVRIERQLVGFATIETLASMIDTLSR